MVGVALPRNMQVINCSGAGRSGGEQLLHMLIAMTAVLVVGALYYNPLMDNIMQMHQGS